MVVDNLTYWRDRRVLITGHSGFIGSWLSTALTVANASVVGFSLPVDDHTARRARWLAAMGVENQEGDIRDADAVDRVVRRVRPDTVVHLAAQGLVGVGVREPHATLTTNVGGSINVLEAVRRHRPGSLVHVTSDKCYRNREWIWAYRENDELGGGCPYSVSKAAAEMVFEGYAANYATGPEAPAMASARFSNVIGGGDFSVERLVPDCVRALTRGEPIRLRMPDAFRPWQHVLDVVAGLLVLAQRLENREVVSGSVFNLTPAIPADLSVAQLVEAFQQSWHSCPSDQVDVVVDEALPGEHRLLHLDGRKAAAELRWRHRLDMPDAVARTARWYRDHALGAAEPELTMRQVEEYFAVPRQEVTA